MKQFSSFNFWQPLTVILCALFVFSSCDDDDGISNPQELITTVTMSFSASGSGDVEFSVSDPDGDGGNSPQADTIKLQPATTYEFSIKFLDEQDPAQIQDLTPEIKNENTDHLICFESSGALSVPIATDTDANGKPLGLTGTVTTSNSGTGSLKVSLKHMADKNGSLPCSTGDTDVEVTFPVKVQ